MEISLFAVLALLSLSFRFPFALLALFLFSKVPLARFWPLGRLSGASWEPLGGLLGASWEPLGASWGPLGAILGPLGPLLGAPWLGDQNLIDFGVDLGSQKWPKRVPTRTQK